MSKIIAFIFGAIIITLLVFIVMLTIHISRVVFARDSIIKFGELVQLALWWLAVCNQEGREQIHNIIFNRKKIKTKEKEMKKVNKALVEYEAVLKWNGELPQYMMGNSVPFINVSK